MKKETIFKHEMDVSSQTKATLNCLNNHNKKHLKESIGEVYPDSRWGEKERLNGPNGMSKSERDVLIKLEQIIPNLVQKAMTKTADHDNPEEIKKLVLNMIMQGNLMQKLGNKVGASWKEFSMGFKRELINLIKNEFAKHEEQEETSEINYAQLADDVCASYRGPLSKLDLKDSINYIVKMVAKKIGKTVDTLSPQELTAIQKAAKHSVWYVSEQEEMTGEDDRKMWQEIPQMEQRDIILAVAEYLSESWIDTGDDGDLDDIYYAVEYLLDSKPKSKDCPQSPAWEDCVPWCKRHYKDVEEQISNQLEF